MSQCSLTFPVCSLHASWQADTTATNRLAFLHKHHKIITATTLQSHCNPQKDLRVANTSQCPGKTLFSFSSRKKAFFSSTHQKGSFRIDSIKTSEQEDPHFTTSNSTVSPNKRTNNMSDATHLPSLKGKHVNVAMMTAGGLAPCLSSSIAQLIRHWVQALAEEQIKGLTFRMYRAGYKGLLTGDSFVVPESEWETVLHLNWLGGSPIGNSRVKLTNVDDCIKRGYVKEGETPLETASQQLLKDQVHVLHTIGGDDTNTQAATLSQYLLEKHSGKVIVVGMPKTIDNDVYPIKQTFGANTAAVQGAVFFTNIVNECTANPRMLILHECMGRDSGYLTAATALEYRKILAKQQLPPSIFPYYNRKARDIDAIWIPELKLDLMAEAARLKALMDEIGCCNVFFGEGTGVQEIVADMESRGEEVPRDAFGHVALAKVNPGKYFSERLAKLIGAEKTIVQKSGYFARSAAANVFDRQLISDCSKAGVASAIAGESGCMGQDEDKPGAPIRAIEFDRIKGGKPFDVKTPWFEQMLKEIGQI